MSQARHVSQAASELPGIKGLLLRWLWRLAGDPVASQRKLLRRLKSTDAAVVRFRFQKLPGRWWRDWMRLDPPAIFRQVSCPMLLIGGGKDWQCDPADVNRIAGLAKVAVEAHVVPDLTHILRRDSGKHTVFRYNELLSGPIDRRVLQLISHWLRTRTTTTSGEVIQA